ncbi:MAG: desulfoferrodoxin FeS4 iron-binding domain-containing protein [Candidatus Jordarchaeaceae archaeon]
MTKVGEIYYCTICGNKVQVLQAGKGTLVCCGQQMILQKQ